MACIFVYRNPSVRSISMCTANFFVVNYVFGSSRSFSVTSQVFFIRSKNFGDFNITKYVGDVDSCHHFHSSSY